MSGGRTFGNVRRLPSGRWQARYLGPDGQRRSAPRTFDTKTCGDTLAAAHRGGTCPREIGPIRSARGHRPGVRPNNGSQERPGLRPRTVELYRWHLRKHIAPDLGGVELGKLATALVGRWRSELLDAGVSQSMAAK